jgi:hypothetical protein
MTRQEQVYMDDFKDALRQMSQAAHTLPEDDDGNFRRVMQLGYLANILGSLCPFHTRLLCDIAYAFLMMENGGDDDDDENVQADDSLPILKLN